jgi:hypothetical protein
VPAHLERAGPFNPDGNNGYNIESLRDFNNAGPKIAFGFETQPGHGASSERGEYTIRRNNIGGVNVDSVGGTTYGGTGVYGAQIGGVWDALLGEGRNWWFFASSDWHNRGMFGPDDRRSTQDFYPGEYQRTFVMVHDRDGRGHSKAKDVMNPQEIVDGLRTGNAFAASGQLIDRLAFVACADTKLNDWLGNLLLETSTFLAAANNTDVNFGNCVTMGEKLVVKPGQEVVIAIAVRDPSGTNYSPYSFSNPSLAQVGIEQPLNKPVLDHIDVIRGMVSGYKSPNSPDYAGQWPNDWIRNPNMDNVPAGAKNTTATVVRTFSSSNWKKADGQFRVMTFRIPHVKRLAVRASARHEHAGAGAVRDRCRWQSAAGSEHERGPRQSERPGRHRHDTGGRQPADSVHGYRHGRVQWLPVAPARDQRPEDGGIRRRGVGGPVVLQQSDLHRGQGRHARRGSELERDVDAATDFGPTVSSVRPRSHPKMAARAVAAFHHPRRCAVRCRSFHRRAQRRPARHRHRCRRRRARARSFQAGTRTRGRMQRSCTHCGACGSRTKCCTAKGSRCSSTRATT